MSNSFNLENSITELLMLGFQANSPTHDHFLKLADFMQLNSLGGIVLFRYNIETPEQTTNLITNLKTASANNILVAVDQEGGKVQRLVSSKGFHEHLAAKQVALCMNTEQAYEHYLDLAQMLKSSGFNYNFAPCIDLDCLPSCPVIGGMERSFGIETTSVVTYASQFVKAHRESQVLTALKHYPGHGRAQADTHKGLVDITNTWSEQELEPYHELIKLGLVDSIMVAHVVHNKIDPMSPASLSKAWIDKIRVELGFQGVVCSDCLHMGAICTEHDLEETIIKGLQAGLDLLVFSNNPAAAGSILSDGSYISKNGSKNVIPDIELPKKFKAIVLSALKRGVLKETAIIKSIERVRAMKNT